MTRHNLLVFAAVLAQLVIFSLDAKAGDTFRGIDKDVAREISSPVFDFKDDGLHYHVDVFDDFDRTGDLFESIADEAIGFVPPTEDLKEVAPEYFPSDSGLGVWMADNGQTTHGGHVAGGSGNPNCISWRVTPDLGNFYLLEMTANVAVGETVKLAYFGETTTENLSAGLDGGLGQLVMSITRPNATAIDWALGWEQGTGRASTVGSLSSTAADLDDEIRLQLGWMDNASDGLGDLFDPWLETSALGNIALLGTQEQRATASHMLSTIDVYGFGFQIDGSASQINSITAAIPEPNSALPVAMGLLAVVPIVRRRRTGNRS